MSNVHIFANLHLEIVVMYYGEECTKPLGVNIEEIDDQLWSGVVINLCKLALDL